MLREFHRIRFLTGLEPELRWAWVTAFLSVLVVLGYAVVAFNWYFQSKLELTQEAKAALRRLRLIVVACALCGYMFVLSDMSWPIWRLYDLVLVALACHTWWFAARMRGPGLLDERLIHAAELERSSAKYRQIAELLPHVVWTATAEGRVDYSNERWVEYGGGERSWLESVHPDEREAVAAWWRDGLAARSPLTREVRLKGRDGRYRTFVVSATPIAHGGEVKWLGACADVEDQKRVAAEKEAQAKQKAFFLNALSHDLRAPLNNVVLNAHLLKMSAREESEVESADVIVENAVAAGEMVARLLEVAKAEGHDHVAREVVSVPSVVRQVARRFLPVAEKKGLYLRVEESESGPDDERDGGSDGGADFEVLTDRQKLERVVANLVDNAVKFTERGGVSVALGCAGDRVTVAVSDTGIGVPEADAAHLFDEFYQVNNHERDRTKGFGMGLAICRNLARQLGGDVRLAATGKGGSRFELSVKGACARRGGRPDGEAGRFADPPGQRVHRV